MAKKTGEKYEAIINAAVKVIARHGYHQAQVSKIAKEANVADGTIYLYFENKEDILISLFAEKMGKFVKMAEQKINEHTTVEEKLRTLVYMHFYQLAKDPDLAVVTQLELRQSDPVLRKKINEILKHYLQLIDKIIHLGIEEGTFSSDIDPLLARYMIFGTLDESVTNWLMKERKYDLLSNVEPILRLLLHGLKPA
ncbi:fatty acid metabolism regulator protein [Caldalkalibacillus thermarum]|uniref:TetR/AcrR family transcriptional regulator n=1 Tax=Caldalkalibacillus thermarum TaxID=296745 RepID=UPI00166DFAF6|nr:TetR/AcrR family transcriptional regulator [Caldalkalibacillus thermarum]GGK33859.1 fatty acid metabolism regulator protein [Caldalkalibacillus thermarum]